MNVQQLLEREHAVLLSHHLVRSVNMIRYTVNRLDGYLRARRILTNDDYLEVALHVEASGQAAHIDDYRYQWMDPAQGQLRRRWDNTPHFPAMTGFPHHGHIGDAGTVEPCQSLELGQLLDLIAALISLSAS